MKQKLAENGQQLVCYKADFFKWFEIGDQIPYTASQKHESTLLHITVIPTVADHKLTNGMVCNFW